MDANLYSIRVSFSIAYPEDDEDDEDDEDYNEYEPSNPIPVNVVITKPGKGALLIKTVAEDEITIEQVYYYSDVSYALDKITQTARQEMYAGPSFGNFDEGLQLLFDKYLDERGIKNNLAIFVAAYIEIKREREYVTWLAWVKNFVGA